MQHIGDSIKSLLNKKRSLRNGIRAVQIEAVWEEIMGKTIAKYTDRIQIINRTLFIYTVVAQVKHEIHFQKEQIVQRVNKALGEDAIMNVVVQ